MVLIVNDVGDEDFADDVEDYDLPILQDTPEVDVFGLYGALTYDGFIIGRDGFIAHTRSTVRPLDEPELLRDELLQFL